MNDKRYRAFMATSTKAYADLDTLEKLASAIPNANYAIILHDKDINASDHYHIAIEVKNPMTIQAIAKKLNTQPNFIAKWDKRIDNLWAYLLHNTNDATSTKADYKEYPQKPDKFRTNIKDFELASAKLLSGRNSKLNIIIDKLLAGEMTRKQLLQPEYLKTYYDNMNKIDKAIKLRTESLKYNPPTCETIYISGASATGKTTKAVKLAEQRYPDSYVVASTANDLLQDYTGEKCLIIDDFRPQDFPFIELLALLDPIHRQKTHRSRYYNKPLATKLIIITSILSLDDVADYYRNMTMHEDMKQLRRRVQTLITYEYDTITEYKYDEQIDGYTFPLKGVAKS
jgi:hypothetical protein